MKGSIAVLIANIPTLICAGIGGLLADRGHPWFGTAFLVLAFTLAHTIKSKDDA
jgi:hypothetical protein